jgi:hypothetical protein
MRALNSANASLYGYNMGANYGNDGQLTNGLVAGLDLTTQRLLNVQGLRWGLRGEYIQSNLSEFKTDDTSGYDIGAQFTEQASLTNVLVGAGYSLPFATDGLSMGLGAWVGAGYGVVNQVTSEDYSGPAAIQSGAYAAILPVAELEASVAYSLTQHVSLSLTGGWRWADAPQVSSGGVPLYNNWQRWYNTVNQPVNADFGGATAQGSVSYSF